MKSFAIILALVFACFVHGQEVDVETSPIQIEAKLGKNVVDRELTEEASTFSPGERAYLWMRVTGGAGQSITVIWTHGDHSYETTLEVGGSPWRTWAYKTLGHAGEWLVSVRSSEGKELVHMAFQVAEQVEAE